MDQHLICLTALNVDPVPLHQHKILFAFLDYKILGFCSGDNEKVVNAFLDSASVMNLESRSYYKGFVRMISFYCWTVLSKY